MIFLCIFFILGWLGFSLFWWRLFFGLFVIVGFGFFIVRDIFGWSLLVFAFRWFIVIGLILVIIVLVFLLSESFLFRRLWRGFNFIGLHHLFKLFPRQHDLFLQDSHIFLVCLGPFVVYNLVFGLEGLAANSAVKLRLFTFTIIFLMSLPLSSSIILVVLVNFFESFFFNFCLYFLHFLLVSLLFLQLLLPFFFFLFLFFFHHDQVLLVSRVSLFGEAYQILYCFYVVLSLFYTLFCVFLLHSALYPSVFSFTGVIPFAPYEGFVSCEVLPVLVKLYHFLYHSLRSTKSFKFSHFLLHILSQFVSLNLLTFYLFEYTSIDRVKSFLIVSKALKAPATEELPNIEPEAVFFKILFGHIIFIEEDFFSVIVIKSSFVCIRKHIVSLLNFQEYLFTFFSGILIRMVFHSHLTVRLGYQNDLLPWFKR